MRILESTLPGIEGIELLQSDADVPGLASVIGDFSSEVDRSKRIIGERLKDWFTYETDESIQLNMSESKLVMSGISNRIFNQDLNSQIRLGLCTLIGGVEASERLRPYLFDGVRTPGQTIADGQKVVSRITFALRNPTAAMLAAERVVG